MAWGWKRSFWMVDVQIDMYLSCKTITIIFTIILLGRAEVTWLVHLWDALWAAVKWYLRRHTTHCNCICNCVSLLFLTICFYVSLLTSCNICNCICNYISLSFFKTFAPVVAIASLCYFLRLLHVLSNASLCLVSIWFMLLLELWRVRDIKTGTVKGQNNRSTIWQGRKGWHRSKMSI